MPKDAKRIVSSSHHVVSSLTHGYVSLARVTSVTDVDVK